MDLLFKHLGMIIFKKRSGPFYPTIILVWRVAHSGGLLKEGAINRRLIFSLGLGFVVYLAAVFVAFVSPYLSLALCMVLWPYWALVER